MGPDHVINDKRRAGPNGPPFRFALPTEAEWEYACRAGTHTPFHTGEQLSTNQANYDGDCPYADGPEGEYPDVTIAVGSLSSNGWGLYDMHGNVDEWCSDWHGDYPEGKVTDPGGIGEGSDRVLRGGSWVHDARSCRSAYRGGDAPDGRSDYLGCRLLLRS